MLASGDPGFFGIVRALRAHGFAPVVHSADLVQRVREDWESARPLVEWLADATQV